MTQIKTSRMLAAALAMTAVASAPAEAAELTYVDRDNVYVENLDGSARHAVSTDGTSARRYVLPTADEQDSVAAFQASAQTGQQEIVHWAYGKGVPVRHRMPRSPDDTTTSPPTSARMQPDGATVTLGYTSLAFGDPAQPRYGRTNPGLAGTRGRPGRDRPQPTSRGIASARSSRTRRRRGGVAGPGRGAGTDPPLPEPTAGPCPSFAFA